MKKIITGHEFKRVVELDPAWAASLTEPVAVNGYCDMTGSPITHLSPYLEFTGTDRQAASFAQCRDLKVAAGTFHGRVDFTKSGVETMKGLIIITPDEFGFCASFDNCKQLKVAEGTFPGALTFTDSGITSIHDLVITQATPKGLAAYFDRCANLTVAEGTYPGSVDFSYSGIKEIKNLHITAANQEGFATSFLGCKNLKVATGTYPGFVNFAQSGIGRIRDLHITVPQAGLIKADFSACGFHPPIEFLGEDYQMDKHIREQGLQRYRAHTVQQARPDMEI